MFLYKKYLIKNADHFDPGHYTFIADDLSVMIDQIKHVAPGFKAEIIVSYLKNHSLQNEWVAANPELVQLVTSKSVYSGKIESLFDSCQNNPVFGQELETYLIGKLAPENI
jgi:hypothetical protein